MLDPQLLRNDIKQVSRALSKRDMKLDVDVIQKLEEKRKIFQIETEELQALRNSKSKLIGQLMSKDEDAQATIDEVTKIKISLDEIVSELNVVQSNLNDIYFRIPNIPHESVPRGKTEEDNEEVKIWSTPKSYDFVPKDHVDLGEALGLIDFDAATKISSTRFVVMHRGIAKLHRAIIQFMLDTHINEHDYDEINVPYLVNVDSCIGTGQLPKFEEDLFQIKEHSLYLIPTAEVPVTNIVRDEIINNDQLPKKFVCHSPCFRSEAGSYGKDTRGMIRQHQFEKVELVKFVHPEESDKALEDLTDNAAQLLDKLELSYRKVVLCTGDLGFSSAKTIDLEVWLPSQNCFREISSCSNFRDFQARRINVKVKNSKNKYIPHTLNGSALAVGRTLVAILENNYVEGEGVHVPTVLSKYLDFSLIEEKN